MTHKPLTFPAINPFLYVSVRSWIKWLFIFLVAIAIQLVLFDQIPSITLDLEDNLVEILLGSYVLFFSVAWLWYRLQQVGVNTKWLIGKIPNNYHWKLLMGLALAKFAFSLGIFRVYSIIAAQVNAEWWENSLQTSIYQKSLISTILQSLFPLVYGIVLPFLYILGAVSGALILVFILYRIIRFILVGAGF